jgi:hypothetical protein
MCRQELKWAMEEGKTIVPVVDRADKDNIGKFITEAWSHGLDLSGHNFATVDRSNKRYRLASLEIIIQEARNTPPTPRR